MRSDNDDILEFGAEFGERVEAKIGDESLSAVDENILRTKILMNELFIVQVAHALSDLRGNVNDPVKIGPIVRIGAQVLVQAHAATQTHNDGTLGRLHARAYEQYQIGVTRLFQIEHFFAKVFQLDRLVAAA